MVKKTWEQKLNDFCIRFRKGSTAARNCGHFSAVEYAYKCMSQNFKRVNYENVDIFYNDILKVAVVKAIVIKEYESEHVPEELKYDKKGYTKPLDVVQNAILKFFGEPKYRDYKLAPEVGDDNHCSGIFMCLVGTNFDFIYFEPNFGESLDIVEKIFRSMSPNATMRGSTGYHAECWNVAGVCGQLVWSDFYKFMCGMFDLYKKDELHPYSGLYAKFFCSTAYEERALVLIEEATKKHELSLQKKRRADNTIKEGRNIERFKKEENVSDWKKERENAVNNDTDKSDDRAMRRLLRNLNKE